jgi:signal transduction histidine kinase
MDAGQLREVVVDLVMNAVESIPEGSPGTISVYTSTVEIDGAQSGGKEFRPEAIPSGQYIALEVRDTGCGMDEEIRNKIFEPFFSTKFLGRGLGLASVYGFVLSHSGGVQVESAPGKGTTFRLLLPAAVEKPASAVMTS